MTNIREAFGDPIGSYAGEILVGVRDEREPMPTVPCKCCGMIPVNGRCACEPDNDGVCSRCGMMPINDVCDCVDEAKKGPTKKTARKMLRGKKTMTSIMKSTEKWADEPGAAATWLKKRAGLIDEEEDGCVTKPPHSSCSMGGGTLAIPS